MSESLEQRLVDLEIRYTHLQSFSEELSDLVRTHAARIAVLESALKALDSRVNEMDQDPVPHEKPPHY